MRIGIVGSGNVGATLGKRFAAAGHQVAFGTRRPESPEMQELAKVAGAQVTSNEEAARSSEVVVLATPWPATEAAVRGLGDLSGKILLDATNPLKPDLSGLEVGNTSSGGEMVARWAAGARVVKIFNTIGYNVMENPVFGDRAATLFYCGDDAGAKATARELAAGIGFEPVDAGPLTQARALEPLALLWVSLAYVAGQGREIAFQLMKR
jgi:8-hydroxy-5-deazaflavin:NADPH oxidoreductase